LPTKGLPLPFISFGGSNLMMNMMAVGVLLSIFRYGSAEGPAEEQEFFARRATACSDSAVAGPVTVVALVESGTRLREQGCDE
jgi:hypothetical protein